MDYLFHILTGNTLDDIKKVKSPGEVFLSKNKKLSVLELWFINDQKLEHGDQGLRAYNGTVIIVHSDCKDKRQ